jgi:hypothetical protein
VIERVHCARCFGFADAARHEWLDVPCLDLDIHGCPVADEIESFRKGRNARTVSKGKLFELRGGQLGDGLPDRDVWVPRVNDGIVVNDDNPVQRRVDIQLYPTGSQLDGTLECCEGVLGMRLMRPPMSDGLGRVAAAT